MLKRLLTDPCVLLGRWEHRMSNKQKEIKVILTNLDHCGDYICGKPSTIQSIIDNTKLKNTSNNSKK
tara:strand:+ start:3879 stop:4079 length:201 start_codon:yes stop_codon:yes gene_type:complete